MAVELPIAGPSDNKCRHHDSLMVNKYDMALIKALGYDSIHMCLRDKILDGENVLELSRSTGIDKMTIRNAAVRMHLRIKPVRVAHGGSRHKKEEAPKEEAPKEDELRYPEHVCSVPGCTRMTTRRFLCTECYSRGDDNEWDM